MMTVGRLAKRFGLSRSTLLYYHRIGLLRPGGHRSGDYRRYTSEDEARLERILRFRSAGLKLEDIRAVLDDAEADDLGCVLERRLQEMCEEIAALKAQQRLTALLLGMHKTGVKDETLNKKSWVALLSRAGFSEDDMRRWHREFEETEPESHRRFLRAINIDDDEAARFRRWAVSK